MRVVLIGDPADRQRLRERLTAARIEVVAEVHTLAEGRAVHQPFDALVLAPTHEVDPAPTETLTPRELEVLGIMAEGSPNKAIARRLGISDQTVKFHVASICGKLGALNRTDAVRRAIQRGLITV